VNISSEVTLKKTTLLLATLFVSSFALADENIVIKLSIGADVNLIRAQSAAKFKELSEKYTKGLVQVEVIAYNKAATPGSDLADIRKNKIQMAIPELSRLDELYSNSGENPYHVMELPFAFANMAAVNKFIAGPIASEMATTLAPSKLKLMGIWNNGFNLVSTNKKINNVVDLKSQTFGVAPSAGLLSPFKAWSAKPREIGLTDLARAMTYTIVSGGESTAQDFASTKMYQSQKYLYLTHHSYTGYAWLVNSSFWVGLSPEVRTQLERAASETTTYEHDISVALNDTAIEHVKATGLTRVMSLSPEIQLALKNLSVQVETSLSKSQAEVLSKIKRSSN
jgi:C4-dicarboxylate-binding protein DctP